MPLYDNSRGRCIQDADVSRCDLGFDAATGTVLQNSCCVVSSSNVAFSTLLESNGDYVGAIRVQRETMWARLRKPCVVSVAEAPLPQVWPLTIHTNELALTYTHMLNTKPTRMHITTLTNWKPN